MGFLTPFKNNLSIVEQLMFVFEQKYYSPYQFFK